MHDLTVEFELHVVVYIFGKADSFNRCFVTQFEPELLAIGYRSVTAWKKVDGKYKFHWNIFNSNNPPPPQQGSKQS